MHFNLLDASEEPVDYSRLKVRVPLSGGINSAAVLCMLGEYHPEALKPYELHLYYAHFEEHSPDTLDFVVALVHYAQKRFKKVVTEITRHSVNEYFIEQKMIPHPSISPCSRELKIEPMQAYDTAHAIDVVLIGYVREEFERYKRAVKRQAKGRAHRRTKDQYPLLNASDDDCFAIVKDVLGWYPAIYDIRWSKQDADEELCQRFEVGQRVFKHNNCLPCKNMSSRQMRTVGRFYPAYAQRALDAAAQIPNGYWGRDDVPDVFKCDVCDRM